MARRTAARALLSGCAVSLVIAVLAPPAVAQVPDYDYATPIFGLAARGDVLFVADSGAGVVRLGTTARLAVALPGVTDVAPLRRGRMWALSSVLTGVRRNWKLWMVHDGRARLVANIGKFERLNNPDGGEIDSDPFDLEKIGGGQVLVADAAANDLLVADRKGALDWVATLPDEDVSTQNAKDLVGCPTPADPNNAEICNLPATIPAQPVSTSVDVGPDGAYYVTELKGFPAPTGQSRIWRIEPDARHVQCDPAVTDNGCTVVADGFTSIVDLTFDSSGKAYVVEMDENSWLAVELSGDDPSVLAGGTVNECDNPAVTPWVCSVRASDLTMPIAVATNASGALFAAVSVLIPGQAEVVELP